MSNRALRRLQQAGKYNSPAIVADDSRAIGPVTDSNLETHGILKTSNDEDFELRDNDTTRNNRFDLLLEDISDDERQEKGSDEEQRVEEKPIEKITSKCKRKNKKKKKRKQQICNETEEDELDEDFAELMGHDTVSVIQAPVVLQTDSSTRAILSVEHKHLNTETELMRIFGSRVVRAENHYRRQRKNRTQRLAQPKDTWPPIIKSGLTMRLDDTKGTSQYFAFEHNQNYQKIQHRFLDAVESIDPQNVMEVMRAYPYHIDTLLQMSDLSRMSEDTPMAADLIERSLYAQESAFHSLFSLTLGNSRLDYKYPENRAFMVCLFRHIVFVGLKGCYRTSLEFCKLLLSLNPDDDPLGVLLMIDFYALLSHEYSFLINLFDQWELSRNLSQLPNFAFSVPLALYKLATPESRAKAAVMLQNSLLMFPQLLLPLLDQCAVHPDDLVTKHPFFNACLTSRDEPVAVKQLCGLYVGRCHSCWKDGDVIGWLEENVKVVMGLVDTDDGRVETYQLKRRSRYRGAPLSIYRHLLISDIKGSTADLPIEIARLSVRNYDPLPPPDSIVTYTHAPKRTRIQEDQSYLSAFFRSLLPSFSPDEPAQEGAAGGQVSVRQGVEVLMAAMRELLHNIQPTAPPVENRHDDDNMVERDDDEWD